MNAISNFVKVELQYSIPEAITRCVYCQVNLQELRTGALTQLKGGGVVMMSLLFRSIFPAETACWEVLKGVMVRNIHKLGSVYAHYVL